MNVSERIEQLRLVPVVVINREEDAEGVLGTAESSTGLFYGGGVHQLLVQLLGVGVTATWAFGLGLIMFYAIKKTIGVRVSRDEELKGLDLAEHNNDGYAGFQIFITE